MAKLKRDDEVVVIAGKDKGKRGTVRRVLDSDRVIVSGVNMMKKHKMTMKKKNMMTTTVTPRRRTKNVLSPVIFLALRKN